MGRHVAVLLAIVMVAAGCGSSDPAAPTASSAPGSAGDTSGSTATDPSQIGGRAAATPVEPDLLEVG
ncbi:MAG: hypothetical protein R2695_16965 [Acidimicrobiales bacterium]